MKTFCFETGDGVIHELDFKSWDEMKAKEVREGVIALDDGREAVRNITAEQCSKRSGAHGWPLYVWADGVHPSQEKELNTYLASHGVAPVKVDGLGGYYAENRSHHNAILAARGKFNRDETRSPRNV